MGLMASLAVTAVSAAPAHAAGATMTVTNVAYSPPSGPLPGCIVPLPGKGGAGSGSYDEPGGAYKSAWEWSVPATITAGAQVSTKVSIESFNNGGASASIGLSVPFEFGTNAGSRPQIIAGVPVGAPGKANDAETYTFTPTRDYVAGEKLYLQIFLGCANVLYEYTGVASQSPCASARASVRATPADDPNCKAKEVASPAPGEITQLVSPTPFPAMGALTNVTVSDSDGSLSGTTIVGEGERTKAQAVGEAVAACWLIGPEILTIPPGSKLTKIIATQEFKNLWKKAQSGPRAKLALCLALVQALGRDLAGRGPVRRAHAAATGCNVRRLAIRGRIRKGSVVSLVPVKTNPPTAVRYRCATAPGGAIRITVDGRRPGGLKAKLGPRLDLGVFRSPAAPAAPSRLTFGFG